MRRALAAIALTVVGLFLVLSYKSSPVNRTAVSTPASGTPTSSPGTESAGQAPAGASPPPGANNSTTTAPGAKSGTRTIKGSVVSTQFGDIQVQVTVDAGNHITDVQPLQLPFDRPRSEFISQQVAPILQQEVMDAQSAQIDLVSGATYTSEAYAESLQAALDQAHRG